MKAELQGTEEFDADRRLHTLYLWFRVYLPNHYLPNNAQDRITCKAHMF